MFFWPSGLYRRDRGARRLPLGSVLQPRVWVSHFDLTRRGESRTQIRHSGGVRDLHAGTPTITRVHESRG